MVRSSAKPIRKARSKAEKPSRPEAENAVRVLLRWAGDNPDREGLQGTPARVARAFEEWFAGYEQNPADYLSRTFEEVAGYDEIVALRDIPFESHCEHHLAPIIGKVHIAYLPRRRVVGISKLARLVDVYAKRLQIQEKMTAEIASCLDKVLKPLGRRRGDRSGASLHDHPRRPQAGRLHGDEPHAGRFQAASCDAAGISSFAEFARTMNGTAASVFAGHRRHICFTQPSRRTAGSRYWNVTVARARFTLSCGQEVTRPGAAPGLAILVPWPGRFRICTPALFDTRTAPSTSNTPSA